MAQSREEVVETMKDVLASELGVDADKVTADARFKEDLDADSRSSSPSRRSSASRSPTTRSPASRPSARRPTW
jgi:hypothetical protein